MLLELFSCLSCFRIPRWWVILTNVWIQFLIFRPLVCAQSSEAQLNITYIDPGTGKFRTDESDIGTYGTSSKTVMESGIVVHVNTDGCTTIDNSPLPTTKWIALISRGNCRFQYKITTAMRYNASAVVIYNNVSHTSKEPPHMEDNVTTAVSVLISKDFGEHIAKLVDEGTDVQIKITMKKLSNENSISKTSVLFVSIAFIVLMIMSLAWLVFYYVKRFRYAHAKERLSRRLASAAKKAIAKIPQRTIRGGDKELESEFDQCAVCIESFKSSEVIRTLPCKHVFHKSCVDPWLLDQRSCPMCKMDILRAYGMQLNGSQDSVVHVEVDSHTTSGAIVDDPEQGTIALPEASGGIGATIKIVHYQPSKYDFHAPSNGEIQEDLPSSSTTVPLTSNSHPVSPANSVRSIQSSDSDCTEFQSLMTQPRKVSDTPDLVNVEL